MLSRHPANLLLRLVLEITGLTGIFQWGWAHESNGQRYALGVALPLVIALLWFVITTPGDPGRTGRVLVSVPGKARLLLEYATFILALLCLFAAGKMALGIAFLVALFLHLFWSAERYIWLYRN
jgi:hypothetical protein